MLLTLNYTCVYVTMQYKLVLVESWRLWKNL